MQGRRLLPAPLFGWEEGYACRYAKKRALLKTKPL